MDNFRIRSSNKDVAVPVPVAGGGRRRSNPNDQVCCKKHPKHRQSPGVCSLCLKEKLSRLPASSSSRRPTSATVIASSCSSSSSLSSYCSSSSASSHSSSPMHRCRFPNEGRDGLSLFLIGGGKKMLTKSRSVAFVSGLGSKEGRKDKTGLLSKLLHPRRVH
ncbi:hypothetical protein V6N13_109981 [Hibiscus sabdariffa]